MSNEYKDWKRDRAEDAKEWVAKYPFLRIKDNSVYPWLNTEEIEEHWLDDIPVGWINAFGEQMCDELSEALGEYIHDWIIAQVKEKFGELVIHYYFTDKDWPRQECSEINNIIKKIEDILSKYSKISSQTCVKCGSPATHFSTGWILPYCDNCHTNK